MKGPGLFESKKKVNIIRVLWYLLPALIGVSSCSNHRIADKPNILFIITDDQGYGDIGANGNNSIMTPGIDSFSMEAVSLTNYHVGTTCAPTRAGLLTGRNCNRNGVWHTILGASILNADEVTLPEVLLENGYQTGLFGKWHLGDNYPFLPQNRGFQEAFYHGGGGIGQTPDYWNNDYFDDTYFRNAVPEKVEGYCTDVWFDQAIQYIDKVKGKPFFCYLSLNAAHSPLNVPQEYYQMYEKDTLLSERQKRFYGMITNIDDNFSKIRAYLKQAGLEQNTILIYTTDNGTSNGWKFDPKAGRWRGYNAGMRGIKASEYEGGHRVPMYMHWPGKIEGGKALSQLTAHVDIMPTLLGLAGITYQVDKVVDGYDISDYLLGRSADLADRFLVTDTQRLPWPQKDKQSCVMNDEYRLVNRTELYHIPSDPGQENNIAADIPELVAEMNRFYDSWWTGVMKESKLSVIRINGDPDQILTCHDVRTGDGSNPAWDQVKIRQGKPMSLGYSLVDFERPGKYKIELARWPFESGLPLTSGSDDARKATAFSNERIYGVPMQIQKAHLTVGNQEWSVDALPDNHSVSFELKIPAGETRLYASFELTNGQKTNAFYVRINPLQLL